MDFINSQYKTVELLKEDKYGCEYIVKDLYKDNMLKRLRVIDCIPETKDFIEYMKANYYDYQNIIHPNITEFNYFNRIRVINARPIVSNKFYYTYEHYNSVNLFSYVKGKNFDQLLEITRQLCAAFKYIHLRGMLFCNINSNRLHVVENDSDKVQVKVAALPYKKPVHENLLIDDDNIYFKAPEVIQFSKYTKQSDVYMLGVILFHIFIDAPVEGLIFKDRVDKVLYEPQSKLGKIVKIVEKCTAIDMIDRYKSVDEVIYDINKSFNKQLNIVDKKYIETFPLYPTSLVARENYMRYITECIHKSFIENSELKTVVVTGSPGTGKGAFLYALENRIFQEDEDVIYLRLKQISYQKYYVITEIIKRLVKYVSKELIEKYKDGLSYIIPEIIQNDIVIPFFAEDEEKEKHKLVYRLGNFILEASLRQPFVFMIKGFEYTDEASKDVFYYIARNQGRSKLFYVISFDNDVMKEEITNHIRQLAGNDSVSEIKLSNLNIHETADLIRILLGIEDVPIDFIAQIYKETDGNPYMVYETMYSLYVDKYIFVNDKGNWVFDNVDMSKLNLDISADEMLQNKINKLEPLKRKILDIISIFGSAVSLDVLENMMDMKFEEISLLVESLISANILSKKMDDWGISVDFNSMTLKKNTYLGLDELTRYQYHDKASRILEDKFSKENRENKDELIYHMTKSGRCDEAVDYLIISAEKAAKKGLIKQAIQFLEEGYGYFSDNNICAKKIEICLKLGDLYYKINELDKCLEYYSSAQHNAEKNEDAILLADSHIKMVRLFYSLNNVKSCLKHSAMAKRIIKRIGYKKGMLDLILALSELMIYRRKYNSQIKIIEKVLNDLDENQKYYRVMFKSIYGRVLAKIGRFDEALIYLEESVEILDSLEEYEGLIPAINAIGIIYSNYYYDIEKATEYFEKNLYICQRTNNLSFMSYSYNNLAEMYREKDKFSESLEYYNKALEIIDKIHNKYLETMIYMNQSLVNMELENYKKSLKCMDKAQTIINESKDLGEAIQYYYIYKAMFNYNIGYFEKAIDYAQKSVDMCISWGAEADPEAFCIIRLCKAQLYRDLDFESFMDFTKELFDNRKYKLGRRACHSFAELLIEEGRIEEANMFLSLSEKYSSNISTKHLEIQHEYLSAIACVEDEGKHKLRTMASSDKTIESNEIKWKLYKSLGWELYNQGQYHEALKNFITSMNALRMLVEGVPDEHKVKFLLSHKRYTVKEGMLSIAQKITGKNVLHGSSLLDGEIKDMKKRMAEYFDYKKFKDIVQKDNISFIKKNVDFDKGIMGGFLLDFLARINNLGQNTEDNIDIFIKMLMELTQAKNAFLAVIDEENDIKMLSAQINSENTAFYKYIMEQARQKNDSIIITDVFDYKNKTKDSIIPKDICAVFCIPVAWSNHGQNLFEDRRKHKETNKISGYIYLDTDTIINNFTQETWKLCEAISKILHLLIDNYNLKKISGVDKLTNLYTRKYFELVLQNEIYLNSTIEGEFSLIMMDIDKFKQVNDRFGHQRGDEVLQKVAEIVMDSVRKSDICARYGGEEFIILLPRTGSDGAYSLGEKIRQRVEKAKLLGYHNPVTISLGIATYPIHSSWMRDLIDKADQALYHSKENGRNRTTVFDINMIRTVKRVDKLAGIISGNMVEDQRNVETMIEILELQRKYNVTLEERLDEFLFKAIEISEADIGYIFILDDNKKIVKEILRKNITKKNVDNISYNDQALQNAIESMSGGYFIDWTGNAPMDPVTGLPNWQSKMVVPFIYGDKIYAVLYLSVELRNKEFDANIYNFITRLCEIITPMFCIDKK